MNRGVFLVLAHLFVHLSPFIQMQKITFSLSFFLRRDKASKDHRAPIYLRVVVNGSRATLATHRNVLIKHWDARIGRQVRGTGATELNSALEAIRQRLHLLYEDHLMASGSISAQVLKQAYQAPSVYKPPVLLETLQEHNDEMHSLIGKKYSAGVSPPQNWAI